jgi:AcrR family transcriptional regulator
MKNDAEQHTRSSRGKHTRTAILAAAFEVLSELGPEATTLRHIARRAGVNIATLMYYFPSKESLVAEVLHSQEGGELLILEKWYASLTDRQLSRLDSLKEALTDVSIMLIDRVIADPGRFRLGVFTDLETPKTGGDVNCESSPGGAEKHPAGKNPVEKSMSPGSLEKNVVRAVLLRAMELGTIQCELQEVDDYIEGYTYLSRGFAIAHIKEIAVGAENRDKIIRRFRKLIRRYTNNMLPGEKD